MNIYSNLYLLIPGINYPRAVSSGGMSSEREVYVLFLNKMSAKHESEEEPENFSQYKHNILE